ncbi:TolC family protein [Trinickia caryophylli]|uniref:Protein CyaE n=1 Tax=Trinickia caryophylli TaxID=28094 RepID=A0A1X7HAS9_TRICW|nr:TolC family protein [Trinickia caryophylli]PMS08704.1 TolC family protein [Trinickia caryophylli]TRX18292.1 TolC family protein [Trinickia caryophylli]WQE10922.1 TolC family protein [Trinickia caryophylli]SMF82822.1 outer membrane protein [Trinickia caryophylli]GLU35864.1 protein CyaE [Trinickia caryophylli]
MMTRRDLVVVSLLASLASHAGDAVAMLDLPRTYDGISVTPENRIINDRSCVPLPTARPLELDDVVLQAVCASPQARRAWAHVRAQTAALGEIEAGYLPTISAAAGSDYSTFSSTRDDGAGSVRQWRNASVIYATLNLNWVLLDFGKRNAAKHRALALLAAANASQDEMLQAVFFKAAQAFYTVLGAQAAVDATRKAVMVAHESLRATNAKREAGAGALADVLQARTSYRRAVLDSMEAEGDARVAIGALAVAIGLDAGTQLEVAPLQARDVDVHADIDAGIDELMNEAKFSHPKLAAARAMLDDARASITVARTQGRPSISLAGSLSQSNQLSHTQPSTHGAHSRRGIIGLRVTIPLFEGFASNRRVERAQAQADAQEAVLRDTELQVSLAVWESYHGVLTRAANLTNSQGLLEDAERALDLTRGRYKEGVGSFAELLNAQTALADAQKQRVLAVSGWRTARLKLAASLGKLRLCGADP